MNVLHIPDIDVNLLSTNVLFVNGTKVNMHPQHSIKIIKDGCVMATIVPHDKLSCLRTIEKDIEVSALKMTGPKKPLEAPEPAKPLPYGTWHRRLIHLGPLNIKKAQQLVIRIVINPVIFPVDDE